MAFHFSVDPSFDASAAVWTLNEASSNNLDPSYQSVKEREWGEERGEERRRGSDHEGAEVKEQ